MFFYVLSLVISLPDETGSSVVTLTDISFKKQVLNRPKHIVWMIMFSGKNCPACKSAFPKFKNASDFSNGMVRFGVIDIDRYPNISMTYLIKSIPQFRIFHTDGDVEYTGARKVKSFLNTAASFIKDVSAQADQSWIDTMIGNPSAILFTDRPKIPAIWAGISSFFHGKSIRIGVSSDNQLSQTFNIKKVPGILFHNGTDYKEYEGAFNFRSIRAAIEEFFAKKLAASTTNDDSIVLMPDEFLDKCMGGRVNCIISVGSCASELFLKNQKLFSRSKMKWFAGLQNLPFKFMEEKRGVWIYNPRKDAFIFVHNEENLTETLESIVDGMGKWIKRSEFEGREL